MIISQKDYFSYLVCSYKLSLLTEEREVYYISKIYSYVLHESLLYLAKNNKITIGYINTKLNTIWNILKESDKIPSIDSSLFLSLKNKIFDLFLFLKKIKTIIALDYESIVDLDQQDFLSCKIKLIFQDEENRINFLFEHEESDYNFSDTSIVSISYIYLSRKIYRKDFNSNSIPIVWLYKNVTGATYKISAEVDLLKFRNIFSNIFNSIKGKNFYPLPTKHNCNHCLYKDICYWRA